MSAPLPVEVTAMAAQQIRAAEAWWRTNRPGAPDAVHHELQRAFTLIASQPRIGGNAAGLELANVRRIYLPVIKQFLYFHVVSPPERVQVVALWHSRRGSGPPI
jgi:plasmid stabilization system protein ParE